MSEHSEPATRVTFRRFAVLAFVTALFTYALIVFGGVVRITGSGMGCGDDWPLCNGRLIPPLDFETAIEYGHRLAALLVSGLVAALAIYAFRHRRALSSGRGILGLAVAALLLLVVQVLVGAVTVWLELPTATVVLHLVVASSLLAANPSWLDVLDRAEQPVAVYPFHMAFARKSPYADLVLEIDRAIEAMRSDGTLESIISAPR